MRVRVAALGLLCAASLFGQRGRHFSWQDSCFKNPGLPYCQGRDYAVKNSPKKTSPAAVTNPGAPASRPLNPSVITVADSQDSQPLDSAFMQIAATPVGQQLATLVDLLRLLSAAPAK